MTTISKVESFIKRMRWKGLVVLGKFQSTDKNNCGFHSKKCPPVVEEIVNFENDLMSMIKGIQFRNVNNHFLQKISNDVKEINSINEVLVPADKSKNIYKMKKEDYTKLLCENITREYKISNREKINNINKNSKTIANKLGVDDRIERLQESEAYITIKDHKENFPNKISCRLINPAKSDIGKISKNILDKINKEILIHTEVNHQWNNTDSVIDWFKNIDNKTVCSFIVFDIVNFYPSITPQLFDQTIQFAQTITNISSDDLNIVQYHTTLKKDITFP